MAHLRRGMQGGHAVLGAQVWICVALLHKVLRHFQVALLARQVQGRGTVVGLGIHSTAKRQHPAWALDAPLYTTLAISNAESGQVAKRLCHRLSLSSLAQSYTVVPQSDSPLSIPTYYFRQHLSM